MKISSNIPNISANVQKENSGVVKNLYTEKLSKEEAKELRKQVVENANAFTFKFSSVQTNVISLEDKFVQDYEEFRNFLSDIGYDGKPIAELSKDEAAELVSEDGIFGVKQTSQRIADFVINGAGGNEELLRAGREGMLQGFKMAEELWGGELPEISQETMKKATELVDTVMHDLGFSILNKEV